MDVPDGQAGDENGGDDGVASRRFLATTASTATTVTTTSWFAHENQCFKNCPSEGYFADTATNTCNTCVDFCSRCTSKSACTVCNYGKWLK